MSADALHGPAAPRRSDDAGHSLVVAGRLARTRGSRRCSSPGPGSQVGRHGTSCHSSRNPARRLRARPSGAEGRKLDDHFKVRQGRPVPAVHPLAVHEGPGANLGPLRFIRSSDLQQRAWPREFLAAPDEDRVSLDPGDLDEDGLGTPSGDTVGPWIDRITPGELAKARGRSPTADEGLEARLVLDRRDVPRLGRVRTV